MDFAKSRGDTAFGNSDEAIPALKNTRQILQIYQWGGRSYRSNLKAGANPSIPLKISEHLFNFITLYNNLQGIYCRIGFGIRRDNRGNNIYHRNRHYAYTSILECDLDLI